MKIKRHRAPLAASAAQQDDSTPDFKARTEPPVHRRTTVTVERETVSVLMMRTAEDRVSVSVFQPQGEEISQEAQTESLPEVSPEMLNDLTGDKP